MGWYYYTLMFYFLENSNMVTLDNRGLALELSGIKYKVYNAVCNMDRNLKSCSSCSVFQTNDLQHFFISISSDVSTRTLIHNNITSPVPLKGQSF